MIPYIAWADDPDKGFWVSDAWSAEHNDFGGPGKLILFPKQRRIFEYVLAPGDNGRFPYQTILYSDVKKTGKTVGSASVAAWYAEESRPGTEIYIVANSQEHAAGLAFSDLIYHFRRRQALRGRRWCKLGEYRIDLHNGTFIQVLSKSFRSSAGSRHALVLFDELWGASTEHDRRLWDEMVPIPTIPLSLRWISSYAGFENESHLLWDMYVRGIGPGEGSEHESKGQGVKIPELDDLPCWKSGNQFTYWSHESDLPWYTQEYLDEQRANERPMAYLRLFENNWVTSQETFIPIEYWTRATQAYEASAEEWSEHPMRHFPVTIAVDAGIRRDSTAIVGVAYDAKRAVIGILFHRIWTPTEGNPVDIEETVETEILRIQAEKKFIISSLVYDPQHLIATMESLRRKGIPARPFEQTVPNMVAASQFLYDKLRNNKLEAYPDEVLTRHIQMAVADTTARGFRIVKSKVSKRHHVDGAVALAMASYEAVINGGVDTSIPLILESPFSDMTAYGTTHPEDAHLPFALRSE